MLTLHKFYRFISLDLWGNLPSPLQRRISRAYANVYNKAFTRHIIKPYCRINYDDPKYLEQFCSATGSEHYSSFQDFFTRVYREGPPLSASMVWPCEGLLCDYGLVTDLPEVNVKGDRRHIRTIFGELGQHIPDEYYFSNVFLHNNNYHRIHSPINGKVTAVEHIPGDLVLLRPWVYKHDPSLPALRNERVNVTIEDEQGNAWYLSIVGGPAVGTIVLEEGLGLGSWLETGDELGKFLLGSTLCMAAPVGLAHTELGQTVYVGDRL